LLFLLVSFCFLIFCTRVFRTSPPPSLRVKESNPICHQQFHLPTNQRYGLRSCGGFVFVRLRSRDRVQKSHVKTGCALGNCLKWAVVCEAKATAEKEAELRMAFEDSVQLAQQSTYSANPPTLLHCFSRPGSACPAKPMSLLLHHTRQTQLSLHFFLCSRIRLGSPWVELVPRARLTTSKT
jgi:hypothetical protein